ncbi:radical SAM protein [bacterium]|nr:radical SAM protein [bacterium]
MRMKSINKSWIGIGLLEECNFSCVHCSRYDAPMYPGYKLSFEQMKLCLSDCQDLHSVQGIHFTGGEPTLWTDGNSEFVDLLIEVSKADINPCFTTNGSHFVDYQKCNDFFLQYLDDSSKPLDIFISIDTFHRNLDVESRAGSLPVKKGRSNSLDDVIKYKRLGLSSGAYRNQMPPENGKLLNIIVVVVVSKDFNSLLPDEMVKHYEYLGLAFNFIPLQLKGKAKSLSHLCPSLKSDKPEDLGAYYRFHQQKKKRKRDANNHIVLFDNDYYLASYIDGKVRLRKFARLGHLQETLTENEYVKD